MQATVIVTASTKAGNLAKLMLAMKKLGYKLNNHKLTKLADVGMDKIVLNIDSTYPVTDESLQILKMVVPNVVNVQVIDATPAEPEPTPETQALSNTIDETPVVDKMTVAVNGISAAEIEHEANNLIDAYPDVRDRLVTLKQNYGGADADDLAKLMKTTGRRLGAHAALFSQKESRAHSNILNSTVKSSLSMSKSQFGGMPVIADLMAKGTPKPKGAKPNLLQLAEVELSRFLTVKRTNNAYTVLNCPHCDSGSATGQCDFILSFLNSFFAESPGKMSLVVKQPSSDCRFEVFKAS